MTATLEYEVTLMSLDTKNFASEGVNCTISSASYLELYKDVFNL